MSNSSLICPECQEHYTGPVPVAHCPGCNFSFQVCDHYFLTSFVAELTCGNIYSAIDDRNGTEVEIELLSLSDSADWEERDTVERRTRMLQGLSHPNLPKILDFKRDRSERLWTIREPLRDSTLEDRINAHSRRLGPHELHHFLKAMLNLLDFLHTRIPPLLHYDIQPSNILFRTQKDWDPVLVGFDISLLSEGSCLLTDLGYHPPEQSATDSVTPQANLYSIGALILFIITHTHPDELPKKRGKIDSKTILSELDERVRETALKILASKPSARFKTAQEALNYLNPPRSAQPKPRSEQQPSSEEPLIKSRGIFSSIFLNLLVLSLGMGGFITLGLSFSEMSEITSDKPKTTKKGSLSSSKNPKTINKTSDPLKDQIDTPNNNHTRQTDNSSPISDNLTFGDQKGSFSTSNRCTIRSSPAGASILTSTKKLGTTPVILKNLTFPLKFTLSRSGYKAVTVTINPYNFSPCEISVILPN